MNFYGLVDLMARLRSPEGCAWDRAQKIEDLRPYIMEEAMELVSAIDSGDEKKIREELGDLLFEIIFVTKIEEEKGYFKIDDVISAIAEKMIERHPHVFGDGFADGKAPTKEEVNKRWEEIKAEKRGGGSVLDGVSEELPALLIAEKYGRRASDVGFDWEDVPGVIEKIEEEIAELKGAKAEGSQPEVEEEMGDLLFSVVNLCRFLGVNAELALRGANKKFSKRFREVESILNTRGVPVSAMKDMSIDQLEELWREAKDKE
ncbi:MAG: nucleoside triphosphate pyrophosphohydrolase [Deltaproteobacteria bacterium]|uniref:Nucleoside triphosphate pyrophosphohydrolase n=1 Tax=Candidatus Zymogenus saltonus TaxID=2844893 RepID=A0A9D8KF18_9DELT|nr:nucleoside triphosphate pyrophosphohydrolase [Candidatus Zymogenus saltonus]